MKDLYSYKDPRAYLRDLFEQEHAHVPGMTLGSFAKKLGFTTSHFSMILDGTRKLSVSHVHKMARKLRFDFEEEQYFEALTLLVQSEDEESIRFYRKRMANLKEGKKARVDTSAKAPLARWDFPAVLLCLAEIFKSDGTSLSPTQYAQLKKDFGLLPAQADEILKQFQKTQLIQTHKEQRPHTRFNRISQSLVQKQYLKSVFAESIKRVDTHFERSDAAFQSHTFTLSPDDIQELTAEYKQLLAKYLAKREGSGESTDTPAIAQASFSLFRVL